MIDLERMIFSGPDWLPALLIFSSAGLCSLCNWLYHTKNKHFAFAFWIPAAMIYFGMSAAAREQVSDNVFINILPIFGCILILLLCFANFGYKNKNIIQGK